jgi:hypothetical protein
MKRNIIVEKLIKEGLSETTLSKLNDKQLGQLAERMLGEDLTTTAAAMQKSPQIQQMAKTPGQNIKLVGEDLKGKQKNIDKNHNGKIDADDFKILNKEKQQSPKETKEGNKFSGELAKAKSQHKDSFDVDGKKYDVKEGDNHDKRKEEAKAWLEKNKEGMKVCKECGKPNLKCKCKKEEVKEGDMGLSLKGSKSSSPKKCEHCDKEMSKCSCDDSHLGEDLKGKQKNIDKNHNGKIDAQDFKILKGQKKEVKEWVNNLAESNLYHSFTSKNEIMDLIQTKLNESETLTHKFGPKVNQGHNGIPEFMSYDAITSSGPATAPTKPKPTTKPGTNPGTKPKTPYQPGPGPNPKPKALAEKKIK